MKIRAAVTSLVLFGMFFLGGLTNAKHILPPPVEPVHLHQGWSPAERAAFYHRPQGTQVIPFEWYVALEQGDDLIVRDLKSDVVTSMVGFIPDQDYAMPSDGGNPQPDPKNMDHLPIGFTIFTPDPGSAFTCDKDYSKPDAPAPGRPMPMLGWNCAACHTGRLDYDSMDPQTGKKKRIAVLIEGGESLQNNVALSLGIQQALLQIVSGEGGEKGGLIETRHSVGKFGRFARRVLNTAAPTEQQQYELRMCLYKFLDDGQLRGYGKTDYYETWIKGIADLYPIPWGYSRNDAMGRGTNTAVNYLSPDNVRGAYAPVSIPHLWSAWKYDWVQWNGSVEHHTGRNIAQAAGVGARLFANPKDRFASSIKITDLDHMESELRKLHPPPWPEQFFPAIDKTAAAEGRKLYANLCAKCHVPRYNPTTKDYQVQMIPISKVGTDPRTAFNFYARWVNAQEIGKGVKLAADLIHDLSMEIMQRQGSTVLPSQNRVRGILAYMARPNAGIWATPPFLHNGSVPSLYALLSPREERPQKFCIGNPEFDPKDVGYNTTKCEFGAEFNTALPGNSNAGHEYRNAPGCETGASNGVLGCELSEPKRRQIIEYLKTCDLRLDISADPNRDPDFFWDPDKPPNAIWDYNCTLLAARPNPK